MFANLLLFLAHYGYLALFVILGISILGIPLPDETFLTFVGFLTFSGKLNPALASLAAAVGSMCGITLAYFLGRFFNRFVTRHLEQHAGKDRINKVFNWYNHHGGKLLTIGYFIPGVRHLSGYVAGLSRISYRKFAFFAYLGAALWTTTWIMLGRLLGSRWNTLLPIIHRYALVLSVAGAVLGIAFYLVYRNHTRWGTWLFNELRRLPGRYLSLGKRRFLVTIGGLTFVGLFIFLMGLIQDLVTNEVGEFDTLVAAWLKFSSPPAVIKLMQLFNALGTQLAICIVFLIVTPALHATTRRWTHTLPLLLAWGGGTLIDHLFRLIFAGQSLHLFEDLTPFQAPNPGFLLAALSFYAVVAYLVGRQQTRRVQFIILIGILLVFLLLGLSPIYLRVHAPSAVVTGMTVSGLCALVCVFVYEFRLHRLETEAAAQKNAQV